MSALRLLPLLPLLGALGAAAPSGGLQPGLWEVRNTPGVATLNGRKLSDLPLSPIRSQRICLTAAEAADPGRLLARDIEGDCATTQASASRGRLRVEGRCAASGEGSPGKFEIVGRYGASLYDVRFTTAVDNEIGRSTFSGRMRGKRLGLCPAA